MQNNFCIAWKENKIPPFGIRIYQIGFCKGDFFMKTGDQKVKQLVKALLIGCGCGIAVCGVLLISTAAVFTSMECIVYPALGPITLVAAVLGGLLAGFVSARIAQRMGLIVGTGAAFGGNGKKDSGMEGGRSSL